VSLATRLLGANPGAQVTDALTGVLTTPGAKGVFVPPTSYQSIQTVTVGSGGSSSITFSSIPSTYKHLQIRAIGKPSTAGGQNCLFNFNGDTGSNYNAHQLYGNGSSAAATALGTGTYGWVTYWDNTQFGSFVFDILDYQDTNKYKTTRSLGGHDLNGSGYILFRSGLWMSTSAINQVVLTSAGSTSFAEYSSFALYGVK
jgi:hypothetical protein